MPPHAVDPIEPSSALGVTAVIPMDPTSQHHTTPHQPHCTPLGQTGR